MDTTSTTEAYNCDPFLLALAMFTESSHADGKATPSVKLLLHVGGSIVTGKLISEKEFAERGSHIWNVMKDGIDEGWASLLTNTPHSLADLKGYTPQFIHLVGAQIWNTSEGMEPTGEFPSLWRGRLNRVDGFLILDQTKIAEMRDVIGN